MIHNVSSPASTAVSCTAFSTSPYKHFIWKHAASSAEAPSLTTHFPCDPIHLIQYHIRPHHVRHFSIMEVNHDIGTFVSVQQDLVQRLSLFDASREKRPRFMIFRVTDGINS
ncbi:hypothetical protein M404DRAFT_770163 [Pisolithus tinctorius Marx 270]|uniref:Uncharacterized protein n=1 Tax=Pisolithus tinctorius Marx 270 TaxID=870435 RepID=A0A0C3NY87_PISTI|nr:hypothetical protein M404DRAFT_866660 [Pisolithus tinctorius Marx 270]KIO00119.1 hypothetical protein M404DRAFT_770163 [Pisolithus tinctorius Marx 270]